MNASASAVVVVACPLLVEALTIGIAHAQDPAAADPLAGDDIRGPRAPVEIPAPETHSLIPWLIAACLLFAGALFYWWWRRRRGILREFAAVDRAMNELNAIDRERNTVEAGDLADRSADVVRRFVAEKFGIAAPRRTTEEFLRAVAGEHSGPLAAHRDLLRGFLRSCDMAKFAGADFDAAERLALLEAAFRFVQSAGSASVESPPIGKEKAS